MAGLDPAIHPVSPPVRHFIMDARVEPAHDEAKSLGHKRREFSETIAP
jgi:hypothetical protein